MGQLSLPRAPQASAPAALAAPDAERVRQALAAALAENTRRAYLGHWAAFSGWCAENGYSPAPAAPETVAAHLASFAETVAASTLKVRRAAIGAAHRAAGLGEGFSGHSGLVEAAGMVIRYTRRETAKRGAVARYLEGREEPPG